MSSIGERYDRSADLYIVHWAPVLDATARRVLDEVAPAIERAVARARDGGPGASMVDVGTGTGVLAMTSVERWPELAVTGVDLSSGMLAAARRQADVRPDHAKRRVTWLQGPADALPLPDAGADAVVSSFVYQLVPDRGAALREAWRIMRPGGRLAFVTWLDGEAPFVAADEFDDAVLELDIDEEDQPEEDVSGDVESAAAAASELHAAGFVEIETRGDRLEYRWTIDSYLAYKHRYAERALFATLDEDVAAELLRRVRERLSRLDPDALVWRSDVVFAAGTRPTASA